MAKRFLGLSIVLCLLSVPGSASTHVWTGSVNEQFSNSGNWFGGSPAGDANADLSFPAGARLTARNDLTNLNVRSIAFSAANYTITGNTIRFGQNAEIMEPADGPNQISCDLILTSGIRITAVGGSGGLTLSGSISGIGGLQLTGGGRTVFSGAAPNTYSGLTRVTFGELQLRKPAGTNAVPGELRIETTESNYEVGLVSTFADEQIPDTAPVTVTGGSAGGAALLIGARETLGDLTVFRNATVGTSQQSGSAVVLGGDVHIDGDGINSVWLNGNFVLPASRTITLSGGFGSGLRLWSLSGGPDANLTIKADLNSDGTTYAPVEITGSYSGRTIVESGDVRVTNAATPVTLSNGSFWGTAASLTADSGLVKAQSYLGGIIASGSVRLAAPVSVNLDFHSYDPPRIQLKGTLDLADAQLLLGVGVVRELGKVYTIIDNAASHPVTGTFHGLPEGAVINTRWRISYVGGNGNDVTLTEVGRHDSSVQVSVDPQLVIVGESATIRANTRVDDLTTIATGTVTFSTGTTVLATAPLVNGSAQITTASFSRGLQAITAAYNGSDTIQPSQASTNVSVVDRTPTISSIDPSTVVGGATTTLTIHGTNFVDGSTTGFPTTFLSSSELRTEFAPPARNNPSQWQMIVRQAGGFPQSAYFPINITVPPYDPATSTPLVFGTQTVSAPVTPGALTAWLSVSQSGGYSGSADTRSALLTDDDHDGQVVQQFIKALPAQGTYTVMDLSARAILAGARDSPLKPAPLPFPAKAFLRNSAGAFSHIVLPSSLRRWSLLWARPGVGAWAMYSVVDGSSDDLDHASNDVIVIETSSMFPVGSSPPPPAGVEPGDLFLGIDTYSLSWFGDRVDDHLAESAGAGTLSLADLRGTSASEKDGVAHITVMRREGTDGAVSAQFATSDLTAQAGIHYLAQTGIVQFAAGEILKTIDIPLIDDHAYSGDETFQITLSNASGATIGAPSSVVATILDGDPRPVVSFQPSTTSVQEGDNGIVEIPVTVKLTGATRVPASANWAFTDSIYYPSGNTGTVNFAVGETQKTFNVFYRANTTPEPDRTIRLSFGIVTGATTTGVYPSITVVDDDLATVSVSDASVSESAGTVTIRLNESQRSNKPVSVTYATSNGTAVAGSDYTATSGTVTFDQTMTWKTITIPIVDDSVAEGPKSFLLTLTGVQNGKLGRSSAVISIVDDDTPASTTPTGLTATATGPSAVIITWFPVANATYEIYRSSFATPFAPLITTPQTWFTDTSVVPGTTYLYKVRAITSGTPSAFGAVDAATTIIFTDDPLIAGTTSVKAVHIGELRAAVTAMRAAAGMTTSFGTPPSTGSIIRAADIAPLRTALDAARAAMQLPPLQYTDAVLTSGTSSIKAAHIQQLRDGCR